MVVAAVWSYQVTVEDCSFRGTLETTVIKTVVGLSKVYYFTSLREPLLIKKTTSCL